MTDAGLGEAPLVRHHVAGGGSKINYGRWVTKYFGTSVSGIQT